MKYLDMSQIIVTMFPVAVMIFYFLYIIIFKRFKLREDIAGDNLYYLGFLFTLTSLSFALYLFAMREGGAESLISNFGIALATTILGLTFRVIFNQMRQDPLEIESEARLELAEAASRLKSELNNVVLDLNSFRRANQQSILEGIEEIGKKSCEEIEKVSRNISSVVENTFGEASEALISMSRNSAKLASVANETVDSIKDLNTRIESIEINRDIVTKKLEPVSDSFLEGIEEIGKKSCEEIEKVSRNISSVVENTFGEASEALNSMSRNSAKLASVTNETVDSIKDLNTRIESIEINRDIVTEKLEPAFDSLIASTGRTPKFG